MPYATTFSYNNIAYDDLPIPITDQNGVENGVTHIFNPIVTIACNMMTLDDNPINMLDQYNNETDVVQIQNQILPAIEVTSLYPIQRTKTYAGD